MSPAAKAREGVNGRTTTSARTSSGARLIHPRGGPRHGPPPPSTERGPTRDPRRPTEHAERRMQRGAGAIAGTELVDGGTRAETDPRGMLDEADVECRTGEQARAERREPLERRRHARG